MKNFRFLRLNNDFIPLLSLLVVILFLINISPANAASKIRLGYSDAEAFPFQINHEADPPGIAIEILSQAAKDIGAEIEFVRLPNKRLQAILSKGEKVDGAFMFSYKEKRAKNGKYPIKNGTLDINRRITYLSYYIYKLKGSSLEFDGKQFSGLSAKDKIGANAGYSIIDDLKKRNIKVDGGSKLTGQNFNKLLLGRIVGYAHQDLVADSYVEKNKLTNIVKIPVPLVQKPYFLLFSYQFLRENNETAEKMWNRIGEIRDSKIKEVTSKYYK